MPCKACLTAVEIFVAVKNTDCTNLTGTLKPRHDPLWVEICHTLKERKSGS